MSPPDGRGPATAEERIPLEGYAPLLFWVFQVALWVLWLIDGLASILADAARWDDWAKVGAASVFFCLAALVAVMRHRHGPLRVDLEDAALTVRTGLLKAAVEIPWEGITRVQMRIHEVEIQRQEDAPVCLDLQSYASVRAVKQAIGEEARRRGIEIDGYW